MKSIIYALGANIVVAFMKLIGFLFSGSVSLLNESIHSLVDCLNEVILIISKKGNYKSSKKHQFGTSRNQYFLSLVVGLLLFSIGGVIGIYESVEKILHPEHSIENSYLIIGIIIISFFVEFKSLTVAFHEIKELNKNNLPLFKFLHETKHSEIIVIFTEDMCAVIGLVIAFISAILTLITGNGIYDSLGGLLIGILLLIASVLLIIEFKSLIIGEALNDNEVEKLQNIFLSHKEVDSIIDLKTIHISSDVILIAAKIAFHNNEVNQNSSINEIEDEIRKSFDYSKIYIYIETDDK